MIPKEVHNCLTIKSGMEKLMSRTTKISNVKSFLKTVVFNSIFHSLDIASAMAYAIENGMDGGYYVMGYQAGNALQIFLFNDSKILIDPEAPRVSNTY